MRSGDDGDPVCGEAAAFLSTSTHEAFRCSPVCFQLTERGIRNKIQLFSTQKEINPCFAGGIVQILISGCQREPAFQRFDPTNLRVRRPFAARFCHSRFCERANSLKDICHLHVSIYAVFCVVFAVIRMAKHAGSHSYWGEGTANIRAEILFDGVSSY